MHVIEIKDPNKKYTGFSLKSINLMLPSGSIMGLVGKNGAVKSTPCRAV